MKLSALGEISILYHSNNSFPKKLLFFIYTWVVTFFVTTFSILFSIDLLTDFFIIYVLTLIF